MSERSDEASVKHLEFIQSTITRLANNSFLIRGWSITLTGVIAAASLTSGKSSLAVASLISNLGFWFLDYFYLRQEKLFRKLYEAASSDGDRAAPSDWAIERFGRHADALAAAVPLRLARAHAKAHAAHVAVGLKKRSPYGVALAGLVREGLVDAARELGESVRDVRGYEYAVINEHALFPYRYADRPRSLDRARLPANASPTRRRLFHAHGPQDPEGLFEVEVGLTTQEYLGLHEVFEELGASTRLVCVFFTADAENGIHVIHWGEAHLEPNRTFTWLHKEQLPTPPMLLE